MSWRKIIVDGKNYRWRGREYYVIQDANGLRVYGAHGSVIKGLPEWEWARWDNPITPADIAQLIKQRVAV